MPSSLGAKFHIHYWKGSEPERTFRGTVLFAGTRKRKWYFGITYGEICSV